MSANDLDRRAFVRAAARGGALLLAGSGFCLAPPTRPRDALRLVFAGPEDWSAGRGATLGVEEAARAAAMFGRAIELVPGDGDSAARLVRDGGIAAIVGGADQEGCRALGALAQSAGVPFVNVGCRADALRAEGCGRGAFHVEASARMYADALASAGGEAAEAKAAVLWHPSLERFGAAQLNDRYRARFGGEMDGPAWAGWMAVKLLWEASLRARTVEPAALRAHLERPGTQWDGHKGWPLSFRRWDRQLRQPLYLVAAPEGGGRVLADVPARPAEGGASFQELLDRLGADASAGSCLRTGEGTR